MRTQEYILQSDQGLNPSCAVLRSAFEANLGAALAGDRLGRDEDVGTFQQRPGVRVKVGPVQAASESKSPIEDTSPN